jgi:hypothetical protein
MGEHIRRDDIEVRAGSRLCTARGTPRNRCAGDCHVARRRLTRRDPPGPLPPRPPLQIRDAVVEDLPAIKFLYDKSGTIEYNDVRGHGGQGWGPKEFGAAPVPRETPPRRT